MNHLHNILLAMLRAYQRIAQKDTGIYLLFDPSEGVGLESASLVILPQLCRQTRLCYIMLYFPQTGDIMICVPCRYGVEATHKDTIISHVYNQLFPEFFGYSRGIVRPQLGTNILLCITIKDKRQNYIDYARGPHILISILHVILNTLTYHHQPSRSISLVCVQRWLCSVSSDYWLRIIHNTYNAMVITDALLDLANTTGNPEELEWEFGWESEREKEMQQPVQTR